ncbi:MAG: hypothetical protein Q4A15_08055, partial [Prevotellaceae bacterium]|nr:hypothetical protein [Prevotellaceae bacterium]
MTDNTWAFNLETTIFSRVKAEALIQLRQKYPKIFFTTSDRNKGEPIYPTVFIHELGGQERNADLNSQSINLVLETLQVEVITDTSQSDCNYIVSVLGSIFKNMRFEIKQMPNFDNGNTYYRKVMRCQRLIGKADR